MSTLGAAVSSKRHVIGRRRMIKRAVDESTRAGDPWETQNLYSDRQYALVISRLAGEIHRWQEPTDDKLRI